MSQPDSIALASAIVALCALVTSIWQGLVTRRHARLSARPIIEAEAHSHKNPGIMISNIGLGPAKIIKLAVVLGGDHFNLLTDGGHQNLTEALVSEDQDRQSVHHYVPRIGTTLGAGEKVLLLSIPAAAEKPTLSAEIAGKFRAMALHVEYESIYEERIAVTHVFSDPAS
jgi:hypothetical protein